MRNPFSKPNYVERFGTQTVIQWATIRQIDDVLRVAKIEGYTKVEIVLLSQWAVYIGFALSEASSDQSQAIMCLDLLHDEVRKLFDGLNNGVATPSGDMVLPRGWISPDGNTGPALSYFLNNWEERKSRYMKIFMADEIDQRNEDALGRVVTEAIANIIPEANTSQRLKDFLWKGIRSFVALEMNLIRKELDS